MKPSRGILRYGLYFFIGAWMFALGVVVGRGTSPVTFDTSSFQERLRVIVGEIPAQAPDTEKVDLDFYEALNSPAPPDPVVSALPVHNVPVKVEKAVPVEEQIPVKRSLKMATIKPLPDKPDQVPDAAGQKTGAEPRVAGEKPRPETRAKGTAYDRKADGHYTIQVAAYRSFKDAVSQMSLLKEKGISSYRTKGVSNGTTWYRVRTGTFKDFQSAQAELNRLKQAKINGMIIKKDEQ